jgi:hypothetical protein
VVTARTLGTQVPNGAKAQYVNTFLTLTSFPGRENKFIACLFDRTRGLLPVAGKILQYLARYTIDSIGCTSALIFFNGANSRPYLGDLEDLIFTVRRRRK